MIFEDETSERFMKVVEDVLWILEVSAFRNRSKNRFLKFLEKFVNPFETLKR